MFTAVDDATGDPAIHGFLHAPARASDYALVLAHGAGANCQSKLLVAVSDALAAVGLTVLRFDLPFRLSRPHGPPFPGSAKRDRDGLRRAVAWMRSQAKGRVLLGGHSYGGRQATILLSEEPRVADGLLLLSYPLHPPRKPNELRTQHFPKLATPAFFVHGTRDPFGTISEMQFALELILAPHVLFEVEGAGHDLMPKKSTGEFLNQVAQQFATFLKR